MKCPYCNDDIHPMAKFCPKCGLPVKDDGATVMGAYLTDDSGPNKWVIGGGALAIVAVALGIGWLSGRRGQGGETVRREPVGRYYAAAPATLYGGSPGYAAPYATTSAASGAAPVYFNSNAQVRWATPRVPKPDPRDFWVPADPEPPRTALAPGLTPRPQPRASVTVTPTVLPLPAAPAVQPGWTLEMLQPQLTQQPEIAVAGPVVGSPVPGAALPVIQYGPNGTLMADVSLQPMVMARTPQAAPQNTASDWTWDPVQERWARRPGGPSGVDAAAHRDSYAGPLRARMR
jgi:hypothetical protein